MMPTGFSNQPRDYRDFRLKLILFERMVARRGEDAQCEAALAFFSSLTGRSFMAIRDMDPAIVDAANGLDLIRRRLDQFFQYDDTVEAPLRCEEYFEKFSRKPNETLLEYELREQQLRACLR